MILLITTISCPDDNWRHVPPSRDTWPRLRDTCHWFILVWRMCLKLLTSREVLPCDTGGSDLLVCSYPPRHLSHLMRCVKHELTSHEDPVTAYNHPNRHGSDVWRCLEWRLGRCLGPLTPIFFLYPKLWACVTIVRANMIFRVWTTFVG